MFLFEDLTPLFPGELHKPYMKTYGRWNSYYEYLDFVGQKTAL